MFVQLHDLGKVDPLRKAEVLVLQNGHGARIYPLERLQFERLQRRLDDKERRKVGQLPAADHLQVAEVREIRKRFVVRLNVDKARHLLERREHLQSVRVQSDKPRSKGEVGKHVLVPVERLLEDLQRSFDDRAPTEGFDIPRMNNSLAGTCLGTGTVTRHTLAIGGHLIRGTIPYTRSIILE